VYEDGRGILRGLLAESTRLGFSIVRVRTEQLSREVQGHPAVAVTLDVRGQPDVEPLAVAFDELDGVLEVTTTELASSVD
jgi:hypothetical protein